MENNGYNVFSGFDGISVAQYVLLKLGYKINKYYASEIDQRPIKCTSHNFPKTIQYGNIKMIKPEHFMHKIDLIVGGSPCQDLSIAGKGAGLSGARSGLFYEWLRLLRAFREINPEILFFLENVRMKKVYQDEISKLLGVEPIPFDSALVSAQTRKRLYWTNIVSKEDFVYPNDRGIILNDILQFGLSDEDKCLTIGATYGSAVKTDYIDKRNRHMIKNEAYIHQGNKFKLTTKANAIDANYGKGIGCNQARTCIKVGENDNAFESSSRIYSPFGKSPCINTQQGGGQEIKVANINVNPSGKGMNGIVHKTDKKCPTLTTNKGEGIKIVTHSSQPRNGKGQGGKGHLQKEDGKIYCIDTTCTTMVEYADTYRKLTPIEVERCFSLPDDYTKGISNSARYHALGNSWEANTIMEFFKHLPKC